MKKYYSNAGYINVWKREKRNFFSFILNNISPESNAKRRIFVYFKFVSKKKKKWQYPPIFPFDFHNLYIVFRRFSFFPLVGQKKKNEEKNELGCLLYGCCVWLHYRPRRTLYAENRAYYLWTRSILPKTRMSESFFNNIIAVLGKRPFDAL